jgi:hypothetical protein
MTVTGDVEESLARTPSEYLFAGLIDDVNRAIGSRSQRPGALG